MRSSSVDQWRRAVFAAPNEHLSDATKVLLLYLADTMRESDLKVSVTRERMARDLNRSERRITERLREATDPVNQQRYLDRVVRGQKGVRAVYQGLMPYDVSGTPVRPAEDAVQGDASQRPEHYGNRLPEQGGLSATASFQRDPRGSRLSKHDATCTWHPWDVCPPDCVNADRRESA